MTRLAKRMPIVTLSWNRMFSPPRILVGAISDRNSGTACTLVGQDHTWTN